MQFKIWNRGCTAHMKYEKYKYEEKMCTAHTFFLHIYFFSCIYGINLWCRYPKTSMDRLRVEYNNAYRVFHNLSRKIHINEIMVNNYLSTFHSMMRNFSANFVRRCVLSSNAYINHILLSTG